ncbi:cation-translocating P-type ATPase [Ilumatobacter sp.]|uniref:cation-translocating P-type ATPase n=1 Tax=Ilumatobacter sp. TaxID=1967498 RepID=UPI003C411418
MSDLKTPGSVPETEWCAVDAEHALGVLDVDATTGLDDNEVTTRRSAYGPNSLPSVAGPSMLSVGWRQITNPMTLMLIGVIVVGILAEQTSTTIVVAILVTLNVVRGTGQEMKAQASVDALSQLQVPSARVRRSGSTVEIDSVDLVPGDIVFIESGDLAPADGRIVTSANLEMQESALTGESAPIPKGTATLEPETGLGDRTNMVFQNTLATRGTATLVVTATGSSTQMGRIAGMVTDVQRVRSPLQVELDRLSKILGALALVAVTVIVGVGLSRGLDLDSVLVLGIATAIASIPTGLPTFVQSMLGSGSQRLAEQQAVVKTLADVETLGGTTAINSDKTGTLTLNQMTATSMLAAGRWYKIDGDGYSKTGVILQVAGEDHPGFQRLGLGLTLCSDATVADDGTVVGDPTEAALVVLAAKMGIDAEETRRAFPRVAEVPFDSAYKFMATFHDAPAGLDGPTVGLVKGAPDVVLGRCSTALWRGEEVPIDDVRDEIIASNRQLSERGLRVLSFAYRTLTDSNAAGLNDDPMALVDELIFVALVGIIDPLRPSAKEAVATAHRAGIDVRMITGDHTITARAIADDLGLGPGVATGAEIRAMSDEELSARLDDLHVFGRVTPEDKLRLAALMQAAGDRVAMTGDAVNDAAALKQADIGVAMGSGSEVTKQAAKMILIDDNFGTLVKAVELGRDIYRRMSAYIGLQLTVLAAVLELMLLATLLDVNDGVGLTPTLLLAAKFGVVFTVVLGLMSDIADPTVMDRGPRDPNERMVTLRAAGRWALIGLLIALPALGLVMWGPGEPSPVDPSVSMTMAFAVVGLAAALLGLASRRVIEPAWAEPLMPFIKWTGFGVAFVWVGIELPMMQRILGTVSLTAWQWLVVALLALPSPVAVEIDKALRRARGAHAD